MLQACLSSQRMGWNAVVLGHWVCRSGARAAAEWLWCLQWRVACVRTCVCAYESIVVWVCAGFAWVMLNVCEHGLLGSWAHGAARQLDTCSRSDGRCNKYM